MDTEKGLIGLSGVCSRCQGRMAVGSGPIPPIQCHVCRGKKEIRYAVCRFCGGTKRRKCRECHGSGHRVSPKSGKITQCSCENGTLECKIVTPLHEGGSIPCSNCNATGILPSARIASVDPVKLDDGPLFFGIMEPKI